MTCRSDCVGASSTSAINVCGVQIRQNCGPGCTGLGNGQSMVQIDASGNLVICSNVGGNCDCETIGTGEDSLVDNDDGTITHTSVANTASIIDICSIVANNCNPSLVANGGSLEFTDVGGNTNSIDICTMLANCAIDDLGDVVLTGPTANQVLTYNGADWVNADVPLDATDVCAVVAANCDIDVTNNGDGTFTITDIGGTGTTIDICQMIIDGGCDPGATDTLTVVGTLVTHTAVDGTIEAFDICNIVAANCNATLQDIGGGVLQFTDNAGTSTNFDICALISANCDINVTDNGDGTFTIIDIGGNPTTLDVCQLITDGACIGTDSLVVAGSLVTHTALDGTIQAFDICNIVAANCNAALIHAGSAVLQFTDNGGLSNNIDLCAIISAECNPSLTEVDGTLVFEDMTGTNTIIDICQMIVDHCLGDFTDTLVDNADGTYTHTAVNGTIEVIDVCAWLNPIDTDCIDLTKTGCDIQADLVISPDDCNGLECRANGAYVNNDFYTVNSVNNVPGVPIVVVGGFPAGLNQYSATASVTVTNPSLCNDMNGFARVDGMQLQLVTDAAMVGNTRVRLRVEFSPDNGVTWLSNANNDTFITVRPNETDQLNLGGLTFRLNTLAPGGSQTVLMRAFAEDLDGNFFGDAFITTTNIYAQGTSTL